MVQHPVTPQLVTATTAIVAVQGVVGTPHAIHAEATCEHEKEVVIAHPCKKRKTLDRLKELEECKELLTEEEYEKKRRSILHEL